MFYLLFKIVIVLSQLNDLNTLVFIEPIPQAYIGNNVTLRCTLVEEDPAFFWTRYPYNNPTNLTRLLGSNIPARYIREDNIINATYTISTITISGIIEEDFSTFECSSINSASVDLIEAPPTTTTTTTTSTTTTSTTTPAPTTTTPDPSTLCFNGNFNHVLFALLLISKFSLAIVLIGFTKLLQPNSTTDVLVTFGCIVGSIGFLIIKVIFWISPDYVSSYPANEYWSPIVIIPSSIVAFCILWGGLFYYIIRTYLKKGKYIRVPEIVVSSIIAFCQLLLLLVILCSVIYCTGRSAFSKLDTNYSVVSNICAGLIVASCFIIIIYFFWVFRDRLTSMEIMPDEMKKKSLPNLGTAEPINGKNEKISENVVTISQMTERKPSLSFREETPVVNTSRKNSKLDLKDLMNSNRSNVAIRSNVSEPRQTDITPSPKIGAALFSNQALKSRDNVIDEFFVPGFDPVSSRTGFPNVEEQRSSFVNIIRKNSVVNVMKQTPQKEFEDSTVEDLKDGSGSVEDAVQNQNENEEYNQGENLDQTLIKVPVPKKVKKKKVKKIDTEEINGESGEKSPKKKKKVVKKKETEESLSKEENEKQLEGKVKKTKKVKNSETTETV